MPASADNQVMYSLLYRHGVDEKGRVQVPFRWRAGKADEYMIVVWPQHKAGTCLRVLPPAQMEKLRTEIEAMPNGERKSVLKRKIGSSSIGVKLDSAGRISIPGEMAAAAEISDQAVLVGLLDRFEIWNPQRYQKVEEFDNAISTQAFELME
jgi:MraZ protein